MNAVSIVLFDPTGRQSGETYPPGSIWQWNDGRVQRVRKRATKTKKHHENKALTGADFQHLPGDERTQESGAVVAPAPIDAAKELQS